MIAATCKNSQVKDMFFSEKLNKRKWNDRIIFNDKDLVAIYLGEKRLSRKEYKALSNSPLTLRHMLSVSIGYDFDLINSSDLSLKNDLTLSENSINCDFNNVKRNN